MFLSGGNAEKREVYCFDAESGQLLWTGDVPAVPAAAGKGVEMSEETGYAASSMATDGQRIYAIFATGDLAAFDFSGRRLWYKNLGLSDNPYGYASSLETYQDRVIVQYDQGDPESGKSRLMLSTAHRAGRLGSQTRRLPSSWTSPVVVEVAGRPQLITVANPSMIAYDPADGTELLAGQVYRRRHGPFADLCRRAGAGDRAVLASGRGQAGRQGRCHATHVAWKMKEGGPDICSPVGNDQFVYLLESAGTCWCVAAGRRQEGLQQELKETFMASPSLVGDKLYVLDMTGVMHIAQAGPRVQGTGQVRAGRGILRVARLRRRPHLHPRD